MKKRIFAVALIVFMLFTTAMPSSYVWAKATQGETSGKCGDNLEWSFSGDTLTIKGSGDMYEYPVYGDPNSSMCAPWYYLKRSIKNLVIEEGVTSISQCAFWECKALTSVTTPASLKEIGFAAFANCTALKKAEIPAGIIGESAFIRDEALKEVTIGPKVTSMGISAFESCKGLERVYISDLEAWCSIDFGSYLANPLQYAKCLCLNGSPIKDLRIPDGLKKIADYAFANDEWLESVTIPSSVTTIGEYAFFECKKLKSVGFTGDGLETIKASAFDSCMELSDITLPWSVNYVGTNAFGCSPIKSITVKQGIIGDHAFVGCGCMGDVTLGSGVTYIGDGAFKDCAAIGKVTYEGSYKQWDIFACEIGDNNSKLINAEVVCTGSGNASHGEVDTGVHVGGTVKFGRFEQDNNTSNGKEAIEWNVLALNGDKALVMSKNVLKFMRYQETNQIAATWVGSSVRSWMNGDFYNNAFDSAEKSKIYETTLSNSTNKVFGTSSGANTTDKVFALSASEVEKYMPYEYQRRADGTQYAYKLNNNEEGSRNNSLETSYYWLRTTGLFDYNTVYVHYSGSIRYDGMAGANTIVGVRPAMWVDKNSLTPVNDSVVDYVSRMYTVALGRPAEESGLRYWTTQLKYGEIDGAGTARGFIGSVEFGNKGLSNKAFVETMYKTFFNREADGGLNGWVNMLNIGAPRSQVLSGFVNSQEFANLCDSYGVARGTMQADGSVRYNKGVRDFVQRLYTKALGRDGETSGIEYWANRINTGEISAETAANGFIFSQEYTNKNLSDDDFVDNMYVVFFNRGPGRDERVGWVLALRRGERSRENVVACFANSQEFRNLLSRYGM